MELGIFSKTFVRPTLDATFDAVASHGLRSVQFNLNGAGLAPLPDEIPLSVTDLIRERAKAHRISIDALSGTFNMAHSDRKVREQGIARLGVLAAAAGPMGAKTITLCTGTRNTDNMWHWHPDNDRPDAWDDLLETMHAVLEIAERHDVGLAIEPEPGNVIKTAAIGRKLLDQVQNSRLGVILDPANVLATDRERPVASVLSEAFDLLGNDVVIAHAKDLSATGEPCAPGQGIVPWDRFIALLVEYGFAGPVIMHGFDEPEVPATVSYLRQFLNAAG
jgi:sugar phosphate isomerase/epimerase